MKFLLKLPYSNFAETFIHLFQLTQFIQMKKFSVFTVFASILFLASVTLLFTSCEQEDAIGVSAPVSTRSSAPEVPSLLEVGEGFEVSFHTYAEGFQVYVSTETAPGVYGWVFKEPIATLYSSPNFIGVVG